MRYLFLLLFATSLQGQEYFSEIITFDENPFPFILLQESSNTFHVASLNFIRDTSATSILTFDTPQIEEVRRNDLLGHKVARKGIYKSNSGYFAFGNDEVDANKDEFFIKMSDNFSIEYKNSTTTPSTRSGAISSALIGDYLYGSSRDVINGDQTDPDFCYQSTIFKFDTLGNEIWQRNYGQEGNYTFMYELDKSLDDNLLAAANHSKPGPNNSSAWMMKLNGEGDILWRYESDEAPANGASPIYVEQLSNGEYLQGYPVDKTLDEDYIINNWSTHPFRFRWINNNGQLLKEEMLTYKRRDVMSIRGIERGKGDYFFAYGYYRGKENVISDRTYHALITKFSNDGDTIWSSQYLHPEYTEENIRNTVTDIIEEENGDIVVLCHIDRSTEQDKIWLFRVNEHGCIGEDTECDEQVVVTSEDYHIVPYQELNLYPNPTSGTLHINDDIKGNYEILTPSGYILKNGTIREVINVQSLPLGIYILKVQNPDGSKSIAKFSKI